MDKEFAAKIPRPPLSDLIDHIDHMVKVAGIDHVGIGSDFDGIPSAPEGIDSAADLPKITAALKQRGYSDADCQKIMSGNLLRVFAQVEKVSRQLQAEEKERPKITRVTAVSQIDRSIHHPPLKSCEPSSSMKCKGDRDEAMDRNCVCAGHSCGWLGVLRSQQAAAATQRIMQFENDDVKVWKSIVFPMHR